jgi:hypothetical protein
LQIHACRGFADKNQRIRTRQGLGRTFLYCSIDRLFLFFLWIIVILAVLVIIRIVERLPNIGVPPPLASIVR